MQMKVSVGCKWSVGGVALIWLLSLIGENNAGSTFYSPTDLGASNYDQLNALLKDYIKILDKVKTQQPNKQISGQVNLRAPRSELVGDMAHALRLYQLAELDRMYGAKSRPRFGKRGDITREYAPIYSGGGGAYDAYESVPPPNDVTRGSISSSLEDDTR